jgi:regulator of replication initiation timing
MPREIDRAELLEIIGSLRQEVQSVSGDVRVVLEENRRLKDELDRLRERRRGEDRFSEVRQIREELDHLVRMHEAATSGRSRQREPARSESGSSDKSAWMKKMMMFMMMAELA